MESGEERPSFPPSLEARAKLLWDPLSMAETELLQAIERRPASQGPPPAPVKRDLSSPDARIRAGLLRSLCICSELAELIDCKGVRVQYACIDGTLDLESVNCGFPLRILDSAISGDVILHHARFSYIEISNTSVQALRAVRLRLEDSFRLTRLRTHGELLLQGASFKGNLRLDGALLSAPSACALNLDGASIGGSVLMCEGFRCDGDIRLYATQIGMNFECSGWIVAPRADQALLVESARIGGSIQLHHGFRSLGQVRIYGTVLDGNLDLQEARLTDRNTTRPANRNTALLVHGSRIKGSILLRSAEKKRRKDWSRCYGTVNITRSVIEGNLDLAHALIISRGRFAAYMLDLKVGGRFNATKARIHGQLSLERAVVGNDAIFSAARLINPGGRALSARGFDCGGSLLMDAQFRAKGSIYLLAANIADEFNATHATFNCLGGIALDLREATIQRFANCSHCRIIGDSDWSGANVGSSVVLSATRFMGRLTLGRTQIGGGLFLDRARMSADKLLWADMLRCKGDVSLDGFTAKGEAFFYGADIQGNFFAPNSVFGNGSGSSLNLHRSRIGGHLILSDARLKGEVSLMLASVGGELSFFGTRFTRKHRSTSWPPALDAWGCSVDGDVSFDGRVKAIGGLVLDRMRIAGSLNLADCLVAAREYDAISMRGASIQGDIDTGTVHRQARLYGPMNISKASIDGSLDLTGMTIMPHDGDALVCEKMKVKAQFDLRTGFTTTGGIDLRDATVGKYLDVEASWMSASALRLEGLSYAAIHPTDADERLRWLEHGNSRTNNAGPERDPVSLQPYEQLIQTLKKQGHEQDAREIAIEKQVYHGNFGIKSWRKRWKHKLYGGTIRFGYRPQRALWAAPVFLLALYAIFHTGAKDLMIPANEKAAAAFVESGKPTPGYPEFSPGFYTLETFVPLLTLQQKAAWRPNERATCSKGPTDCGSLLSTYVGFHMAAGWIITTLAVAGFTGLVRKD